MDLRFTALLFCCAVGTLGHVMPRQVDILSEEEIDNISDSSSDIIPPTRAQKPIATVAQKETEKTSEDDDEDQVKISSPANGEKEEEETDEEETDDDEPEVPTSTETSDSEKEGLPLPPPTDAEPEKKDDEDEDEEDDESNDNTVSDPKVFGMNIGLHYILADINNRLNFGDRVHLESLIKVLVLTHKIEKVGGTLGIGNEKMLRKVAKLYPASLKEAMIDG